MQRSRLLPPHVQLSKKLIGRLTLSMSFLLFLAGRCCPPRDMTGAGGRQARWEAAPTRRRCCRSGGAATPAPVQVCCAFGWCLQQSRDGSVLMLQGALATTTASGKARRLRRCCARTSERTVQRRWARLECRCPTTATKSCRRRSRRARCKGGVPPPRARRSDAGPSIWPSPRPLAHACCACCFCS